MSARQGPAFAGLLIAVLCWSGNALVGRAFHDSIPPLSLSFWRWVLATSLLLPFVAKGIWTHRATLRRRLALPVLAAMGIASYNSLLYTAAQSTEAINLTLVNTCLPLATFIGAGFLLGEWPLRRLVRHGRGGGRAALPDQSRQLADLCQPIVPARRPHHAARRTGVGAHAAAARWAGCCWCRRWCCWVC